jgi:hypothetical protein
MPAKDQPLPKPIPIQRKYQNAEQSGLAFEVKEGAAPGSYDIFLLK